MIVGHPRLHAPTAPHHFQHTDTSLFAAYSQEVLGAPISGEPDVLCGYYSPVTMPGIRYGEPGLTPAACAAGDLAYNADKYGVRPVDLPVDRFWPITTDDVQVWLLMLLLLLQ